MTIKRHHAAVGFIAAGTLVLSACGSDPTPPPGQAPAPTPGVECGGNTNLTAEGSSAQANAFTEFTNAFIAQCPDNNIDYNPSGSGAGVKQFSAGQVDLGGSDSPLKDDQVAPAADRCGGNPALHLPLVFGPIAVAYNVDGVDELALKADTIAKIFSGQIKTWNDPAIAESNPGKKLPDTPINVVYRNDDSGTTDNFQKYLETAAPQVWDKGDGKKFNGGVGEGKAKSQGVADTVKSSKNSITYVESSYATNSGLGIVQIDNGAGPVALNDDTAGTAIADAKIKEGAPNDLVMDLDTLYGTKKPGAYPLMLVTYELVCSEGYDPETAKSVKSFLKVSAGAGQDKLSEAGYVPLPDDLRGKVNAAIDSMA